MLTTKSQKQINLLRRFNMLIDNPLTKLMKFPWKISYHIFLSYVYFLIIS
jgi:predicted nucleic acid-binding protein